MQTKKIKCQKPISLDLHLQYRCSECDQEKWLSLVETQTKRFKVVCDCGNVFSPKQIDTIKIVYKNKTPPKNKSEFPEEYIRKCTKSLMLYGFSEKEAYCLLSENYIQNPTDNCLLLIKQTLANLNKGIKDNE